MNLFKRIVLSSLVVLFTGFFQLSVAKPDTVQTAIFAGGCFWCTQADFDKLKGVIKTVAGYTGGTVSNPTYKQVTVGGTGHYESVEVYYDPKLVTYRELVDYFWHHIDPTDASGQFCDKGDQYRSAIFYSNAAQKRVAEESKQMLMKVGRFNTVATSILPAKKFYPAEDYHQEYYLKNPLRYRYYRFTCGRDQRIEKVWGIAH